MVCHTTTTSGSDTLIIWMPVLIHGPEVRSAQTLNIKARGNVIFIKEITRYFFQKRLGEQAMYVC